MLVGTSFAAIGVDRAFFAPAAPIADETGALATGETSQPQNAATTQTGTSVATNSTNCVTTTRGDDDDEDDDDDKVVQDCTTTTAQATPTVSTAAPKPATQPTTQASGTYTMAQVATHNSATSCYTVIGGSVYNLTSFVSQHPGGSVAIKSLCGVDGTAAYTAQHSGARRPANELAGLKIGTLAQ